MTFRRFIELLVRTSLGLIGWMFLMTFVDYTMQTIWIYTSSVSCFFIFCTLIYFYALNTSKSDQLFSFNNVVSASFLIKMIMSIGLLMLYQKIVKPIGNSYILHFIIVYLVYTAFEVFFLTKLAKSSE